MRKIVSLILTLVLIIGSFYCVPFISIKAASVSTTTVTPQNEEEAKLLQDLMEQYTSFVVVRHKQLGGSHYAYTESLSDTHSNSSPNDEESLWNPGSQLVLIELAKSGASVKVTETVLIDSPSGVLRDPDVSEDGTRVIFSWKKDKIYDDYHLYEYDLLTNEYRQLTFDTAVADTEPKYLPNGNIVFSSTRMTQTIDCWYTPVSNLYICGPDGEDIVRVGYDQVHTTYPTVTEDGRVLYTRWDYNDRTQVFVQGIFQMFPDGTNQTEVYGNNSNFPTSLLHTREVKGTTDKYISIASGHHVKQAGKLVYVDTSVGRNDKDAVTFVFPDEYSTKEDYIDKYGQKGPLYKYPYSISEDQFLVSYAENGWGSDVFNTAFGIYLMDTEGNKIELVNGSTIPASQIVPVAERTLFERASMVNYGTDTGTYYIADIYEGDGLKDVERGTAKYLRVVALDYRAYGIGKSGQGGQGNDNTGNPFTPISSGNGSWDTKRILGIVPIEEDGSALFKVPSETPVYFQVLDKDGQMIQSMRSWSTVMPGETFSCIGCHEDKNTVPPASATTTIAMSKGVTELQRDLWMTDEEYDPYEDSKGFDYLEEIQPILDESCVECHNDMDYSLQEIHATSDIVSEDSPVEYKATKKTTASSQTETTQATATSTEKTIDVINEDFSDFKFTYGHATTLNMKKGDVYWRVYSPNVTPTADNIVVPYTFSDNGVTQGPFLRTKTYNFNSVFAAANVEAGKTYTFSVDLCGRGTADSVALQIRAAKVSGDTFEWDGYKIYADKASNTFNVPADYNFRTFTYTFTPDISGLVAISLDNGGKSLVIDNFKLTTPDLNALPDGVIFLEDFSDFDLEDNYNVSSNGTQTRLHLISGHSASDDFGLDSGWDNGTNTVFVGKSWHQPIDIVNVDVEKGKTYTFSFDWAPNITNDTAQAVSIQIRAMQKTSSPEEWIGWVSPDIYYAKASENYFTGQGSYLRTVSYTFTATADSTLCFRIQNYQAGGYAGAYMAYDNIKLVEGIPEDEEEETVKEDAIIFVPVRSSGWKYMYDYTAGFTAPTDDSWTTLDFNDGGWKTGTAGFGASKNGTGYSWNTWWSAGDGKPTKIWMRKTFNVTAEQLEQLEDLSLYLDISYSRSPTVYINGELVYTQNHYNSGYNRVRIADRIKSILKEGTNVIAVYAAANGWGNFIDVGLAVNEKAENQFSLQNVWLESAPMLKSFPMSYLYLTNSIYNLDSLWFGGRSSNYYTNWIDSMSGAEMLEPYWGGSSKSYLVEMLRKGHQGVNLTEEELQKIQVWIDLGVPCYGEYDTGNFWNDNTQRWADESQNKRDYYVNMNNVARLSRSKGGANSSGIKISYTSGSTVYNKSYNYSGAERLDVPKAYASGDTITVTLPEGKHYLAFCLNNRVGESIIYVPSGVYTFTMPAEMRTYNNVFARNTFNNITARIPTEKELAERKNITLNPYDFTDENGQTAVYGYPHAEASTCHGTNNAQFVIRNAIDGITGNLDHGYYPSGSWGPESGGNQWLSIDFGREVEIDEIVLYIRADFPHDEYWRSGTLEFSDGSTVDIAINGVDEGQSIKFPKVTTTSIKLKNLVLPDGASSVWAGISEIEVYGYETQIHNLKHVTAKEPDCTQEGNVEAWVCGECSDGYLDSECTEKIESVTIPALGHDIDYKNGKVVAQSTVSRKGEIEYFCTRCNEKETEFIPTLGNVNLDEDGTNSLDLTELKQRLLGIKKINGYLYDVNIDDKIDIRDIIHLKKLLASVE